jgi:hypothetical protein
MPKRLEIAMLIFCKSPKWRENKFVGHFENP